MLHNITLSRLNIAAELLQVPSIKIKFRIPSPSVYEQNQQEHYDLDQLKEQKIVQKLKHSQKYKVCYLKLYESNS